MRQRPPIVIAHRGASGYRPEHTLASYALAIRQCADVIEPDVVMTKDDVPVARHENEIGDTTDVADHPEFADRRTTKIIDGSRRHRLVHRGLHPGRAADAADQGTAARARPANTAYDGQYPIPTLAEVLDLARHSRTAAAEPVGVTPETKHPTYFAGARAGPRGAPGRRARTRRAQPVPGAGPELRGGQPPPAETMTAVRLSSSSTAAAPAW